jgi:hypothetical protein
MRTVNSLLAFLFVAVATGRAEVVFSQPAIDLGNVRTGQAVEQSLSYQNRGSGSAELLEIKGSCSCLVPDSVPKVLAAGQSATLRFKVDTLSAPPGQQLWRLTLRYREAGQVKGAEVTVRAMVIQEIIVQPPEIMVYGSSGTRHEINVVDTRAKPLHVLKVEASSPYLHAAAGDPQRDEHGRALQPIHLQVDADLPPGRHDEQLTIYTDDPLYRELKVSIIAFRRARQRYTATPPAVALYASPGEMIVSRVVAIRDQQGQQVVIDQVVSDDPSISCQWSREPSAAATVKVTVHCDKVTSLRLESKIHVQFRSGEQLTIPVTCEGR